MYATAIICGNMIKEDSMDIVGNDIFFSLYGSDGELIQKDCIPYHVAETLMKRKVCEYKWELQGIQLHEMYERAIAKETIDAETHLIAYLIKSVGKQE